MDRVFYFLLIPLFSLLFGCSTEPPKIPRTGEEYLLQYSLDRLECDWEGAFLGQGEEALWTWTMTPENYTETAVFIHGYLDHSALSYSLFEFLLQERIRIVAFDLPGHGRSGGRRASLHDFDEYRDSLDRVVTYWGLSWGETLFIGHSTGASLIMDRLIEGVPMKGAVLAGPLVQFRWYKLSASLVSIVFKGERSVPVSKRKSSRDKEFKRKKRSDPLFIERMPLNWPRTMFDWYETLPEGKASFDGPILVLQGEKDHVVYYERNIPRIVDWFPQTEVLLYPHLKHHILNEADTKGMYGDLRSWINQSFFS
ncbi:MAG: alpha/beta fold hydrolase [Spirochaetales bacterium]|nr:alpha/beta fold hydrolase [Spirochaetales bacterium]